MCALSSFIVIGFILGTTEARQADIDINRIKLISNEAYSEHTTHLQRPPEPYYHYKRSNDYDDHSSRFIQPQVPLQLMHDATEASPSKPLKVHKPREDPRLFYQSDAYIKEVNRKNLNGDVSLIYPGRELVRANEQTPKSLTLRLRSKSSNRIHKGAKNLCVKCPYDRTLVAKPGSDRVMLQHPRLTTCSGEKAPRDVRFMPAYGPKFGSLISPGSHVIIGRIFYKNRDIQMCKIEVHVITQTCSVPSSLISRCDERTKVCNFTCRDPKLELHGHSTLACGDNLGYTGWTGTLPFCRARSWCEHPAPPEQGHLSCKGSPEGPGLAEGSTCRVRCARGWHWTPRAATVCRRGSWTFDLNCSPKTALNGR